MISNLLGNVLRTLRVRAQPVRSVDDLEQFLKEQSAFVSQKTVVEYCRIKAGVRWQKLFAERAFSDALEQSRWISMRAVLCDMAVIVEGYLRPVVPSQALPLADAIVGTVESILAGYDRGPAWQIETRAMLQELRRRLARVQMAAPLTPDHVARTSGAVVFEALPVHSMLRAHDREVIVNNTRFGMVRFWETLIARAADREALVASLLAATPDRP